MIGPTGNLAGVASPSPSPTVTTPTTSATASMMKLSSLQRVTAKLSTARMREEVYHICMAVKPKQRTLYVKKKKEEEK